MADDKSWGQVAHSHDLYYLSFVISHLSLVTPSDQDPPVTTLPLCRRVIGAAGGVVRAPAAVYHRGLEQQVSDPELLHHRPHRPRQVDAGGSPAGANRRADRTRDV